MMNDNDKASPPQVATTTCTDIPTEAKSEADLLGEIKKPSFNDDKKTKVSSPPTAFSSSDNGLRDSEGLSKTMPTTQKVRGSGWGIMPGLGLRGGGDTSIANGTSGWGPPPAGGNPAASNTGWGAPPPPNAVAAAAWGAPAPGGQMNPNGKLNNKL